MFVEFEVFATTASMCRTWKYEALAAASSRCKLKAVFDMLLLQTSKPCGRAS